jgi:hypothetical protein
MAMICKWTKKIFLILCNFVVIITSFQSASIRKYNGNFQTFDMLRRRIPCISSAISHRRPTISLINTRRYSYFNGADGNEHIHLIDEWANNPKCKISQYFLEKIRKIERPAAVELIPQLANGYTDNELGYIASTGGPAKKGTLLDYVITQKKMYPDKVILTRCGDFYETYGVDAIMLVNYCGLNAMAGKAKAGCPIKNIQGTLDGLTSAGLTVAVYEELNDVNADRGPSVSYNNTLNYDYILPFLNYIIFVSIKRRRIG